MLGLGPLGRYALGQFATDRRLVSAAGLAAGASTASAAGQSTNAAAGSSTGTSGAAAVGTVVIPAAGRSDGASAAAAVGAAIFPGAGRAAGSSVAVGWSITFQSNMEIICIHWEDRAMSVPAEYRIITANPAT